MVYTNDAEDMVTGINRAGLALFGRTRKDEMVGKPFPALALNPSDREVFLRKIRKEGFVDEYKIVLKRADDSTVFCLENATSIRDEAGRMVEIHGIVKDISDRIESEQQLWKTNLELADANMKLQQTQALMVQHEKLASIGQLAAGIAHEINNPLGFLRSNHAMLEKYFVSIRKLLEKIPGAVTAMVAQDLDRLFATIETVLRESNDGFTRIQAIVANLKSFSRIDRSSGFEDYDLNNGIENTLVVAWNELKYVAEIRKELGEIPHLHAKGGEINQVILNILVNAAQAIGGQRRPAKGTITIRTRLKKERVILEIEDDGPGIPDAIKSRIFDPFFTTKEPGKGTGLGLSISYDIIVHKHAGRLNVGNAPEGGTRFKIELPVVGPPTTAT